MKISLKLILTTFIISVSGLNTALAADSKKPVKEAGEAVTKEVSAAKEGAATKKNTYPLYGQVISAEASSLTIKGGEGKGDRKFSVTPATIIMKGDKPATMEDIKDGQWIGGKIEKSAEGNDKVLKLNLEVKQKEAKPVAKLEAKEEIKEETKPKMAKKKES